MKTLLALTLTLAAVTDLAVPNAALTVYAGAYDRGAMQDKQEPGGWKLIPGGLEVPWVVPVDGTPGWDMTQDVRGLTYDANLAEWVEPTTEVTPEVDAVLTGSVMAIEIKIGDVTVRIEGVESIRLEGVPLTSSGGACVVTVNEGGG